ncbi:MULTISPECIES: hypothetical protein [Streptomyces]|uniref:Uncharacterized protein n=2 Tax=Streptomyces TaxID=1883 RepID=A0A939FSZ8_9ACTN|nr:MULTISPECIES: hypothetical protein [Streptomyces]MBO0656284.1 hypothetical protein [Streptomyces triculaminicus]QSY50266.1 hypothetical protein J3S04_04300 [Streptomyces griseocarneus]
MESNHSHLTPDLPPIVEIPDLPGAQHDQRSGPEGGEADPAAGGGHGSGAHQEVGGRHERTGEGSGG